MVQGVVNDELEAVINLSVLGPSGDSREIEAVVDTGFNGFIFLPSNLASELSLEFAFETQLVLADGTVATSQIFSATVIWDGRAREVQAIASTGMSLIRMRMLEDHDLRVEVKKGGKVLIESPG